MTVNQRGAGRGAGGGRTNFVYKPRTNESANARRERYQSGNRDTFIEGNVELWKPKDGDNWIRILPPTWENADHYAFELYVHYEVGPDNNTYLCPKEMKGERCGLCEEYHEAKSAKQEDYARALEVSMRLAAWIIDREEEKKGPQLWLFSTAQDREIMQQAYDRRTGETYMIDHPTEGFDVEFTRKGKGLQTKYSGFKLARQSSEVAQSFLQVIADTPIPTILKYYDNEYIMAAFAGTATPKPEDNKPTRPSEQERQQERQQTSTQRQPVQQRAQTGGGQQRQVVQPRQETQQQPSGNAARRARLQQRQQPNEKQLPDFYSMTIEEQIDWAEQHNLDIPEDVPDDGIAKWLEQKTLEDEIPF